MNAIQDNIYTKQIKGVDVPFIKCLIRDKEIRITPEEAVRQLFIYKLIHEYKYKRENIKLEHAINFGREVKRADIVIFDPLHPESEYIIVEVKKPKLLDGKGQLKSYCNATGALIGVWTNGQQIISYRREEPNIFVELPGFPRADQKLRDILTERFYIKDLAAKDKLAANKRSLKALIQEMEDEVLANAGVDAFEEVFKLIYTKLYDEMQSTRDETRALEFRNYGDTDNALKQNIQELFKKAQAKWPGVFSKDEKISLTPSHLSVCVASLQEVKLFNSNLDVIDDAFEYLMNKSQKGEKGQFFTPRYIIDMCVRMLNPSESESMIDTAAGSCGFPVHTMFYVWRKIYAQKNLPPSNLFTAEKKLPECEDYVREKVFAIDFDEKAVRVARTLNLIAGDGRTNVLHLNTLDYMHWDDVTNNKAWQKIYYEGWLRFTDFAETEESYKNFNFDIVMANPPFAGDIQQHNIIANYELGKNSKGKYQSKVGRDILFIERNLSFLKPGGRMAIILPQGRFNNSSDKYIRDFIAERCRILAVIGLHGNVFKPHTGTKTSVLLVQKWDDDLCPRRDDYPIFFATMQKPSKDNSGEKIYRKDENGNFILDSHNHLIVDHDLFNHEGLTQDGIAEAFIEFAKRENLSFFLEAHSSFNEAKYQALMSGLDSQEVMLSALENGFTLGAEYYGKKYIEAARIVESCSNIKSLGEISRLITDGDHGSREYYDSGVPCFLSETIEEGYIDNDKIRYISYAKHATLNRSVLRPGDVIVTKTGVYFGKSAVMPVNIPEANMSADVGKITLKKGYNPYFVSAFLNCKYGYYQLRRRGIKATRPRIILAEFQDILIPKLSDEFDSLIEKITRKGINTRAESVAAYTQAQEILQQELNFPLPAQSQNITTKLFSFTNSAGRLDAEYFMPKYDYLLENLPDSLTVKESCKIHNENFNPASLTEYKYIELADVGTFGNITGAAIANGAELPTRARRIVHTGQVIVSSIEGSIQKCAIITGEYDGALCSTGFYVLDSDSYNPETLLLLFKSELVQNLLKRSCSGTILSAISDDGFKNVRLPCVSYDTQQKISSLVQKSFTLRRESENLINFAVKSVELAIESGESDAIKYISAKIQNNIREGSKVFYE
ncbi:MAG: N-6 DNA methylase [Synergistaceae bacterium]|nr:N-6 DNA methylase [Synergistaceae bacterium]